MRAWWAKIAQVLRRRKGLSEELDEEVRSHLDFLVEENLAMGMAPREAEAAARRYFGNVARARELASEAWQFPRIETILQDIRYGLRGIRRSPSFSLVVVLTLALGIGANTAIFSVVYAVLLRPLPYPAAERLVWLAESAARAPEISVTWINFQHWRKESNDFENMAGFATADLTMTGRGDATLMHAGVVTSSFFPMTGARPFQGRLFTEADDRPGAEPTVVVTPEFWQRTLGSDPRAIGTSLDLNGRSYRVIGVLQPGLNFFLRPVDFYLPLGLSVGSAVKRSEHKFNMRVLGLLKPGITLAQARSNLDAIMQRLALSDPGPEDDYRSYAAYLTDKTTGGIRQTLYVLMGAVGLVLVIAGANVASLLLVRSTARAREMAIRVAIGAGRARLARQLLTENLVIGTLGGGLGLVLAAWCLRTLVLIGPRNIPRLSEARLDVPVLWFAAVVTILVALLAGVVPTFSAGKVELTSSLKEGSGAAGAGRRGEALRGCLVIAEIAITLILAFASGLLVRSLVAAQTSYPGFDAERVMELELQLPPSRYTTAEGWRQYYSQLIESLRSEHGVEDVGAVMCPPGTGGCLDSWYSIVEKPAPTDSDVPVAAFNIADTSYFGTMHIHLLAGRGFSEEDRSGGLPVTVINELLARSWWSDPRLALGQHLKVGGPYMDGPTLEIVGVAANVSQMGLDGSPIPEFYYPFAQHSSPAMVVMIRTSGDPAAMMPAVRRRLSNLDRNVPIQSLRTVEQYLGASLDRRRFSTILLGLFAALAMILAAVGTFGVLNYWVSTRQKEIAIRLAIGARPSTILRWAGYQAARLAALGIFLGVFGGWGASRWIRSMVFGVSTRNPAMMVAAGAAVMGIAVAASTLPTLRAMRVDPITALRQE
jgi:putative ABC transport system permease protein